MNAPSPKNLHELRSLLGLINYYGKFIPNLATILHPLNDLLKDSVPWEWSNGCEEALGLAKQALVSSEVLMHYDPALPLRLATDASQYGVGAVLSHIDKQGNERPIAYASRTLTKAERNYAQIEREGLAIIFGVKKFHQYVCGRKFQLLTDHKPLTAIFHPSKGISAHSAARLQRWAIFLTGYTYDIEYKPTKTNGNADALSRLPLGTNETPEEDDVISLFQLGQVEQMPIDSRQVKMETEKDRVLSQILHYSKQGWPNIMSPQLKPYYHRRNEIVCEGNILLWGIRVIIPDRLQKQVLQMGHHGINRMKALARSYCWWPGIDTMIENMSKSCVACREAAPTPVVAPLHPWIWPSRPWQRIHADFAGPIDGKMYLLIVDAHSKWPEIIEMSSTTAQKTVNVFCSVFARFGLPELLVTDNGPQFVADEFYNFLKRNGIRHIRSAPYNPASNGQVERLVQTFKKALVKGKKDGMSHHHILTNFLMKYRTTPHSTTGVPPCELMFKRSLRTVLDLLKPSIDKEVVKSQAKQKQYCDKKSRVRNVEVGQMVLVRDYRNKNRKWVKGVVKQKLGNVMFLVEVGGHVWKRHINQMHIVNEDLEYDHPPYSDNEVRNEASGGNPIREPESNTILPPNLDTSNVHTSNVRRYPQRHREPPARFCDEQLYM